MQNNKFFPEIKGNFGFGCMRLPMNGSKVDYDEFNKMTDAFISAGFNYFDTAHVYIGGQSETAIRDCVANRYDRSKFLLTDKLTDACFRKSDDIRPFIEKQLKCCGVDYFDFYLMHAQDNSNYEKYKETNAYEIAYKFKDEGLIKHFGISFHDKADVLDKILHEHPEVEIVQIQFNYLDYDDVVVESRKVYEVCEKYNKPVVVMEPVKGGSLVNLPPKAANVLTGLEGKSNASYAMRFAAGFDKMAVVISGMSNYEQMLDNIDTMKDLKPLDDRELTAIEQVVKAFGEVNLIPCTSCKYCIEENECPKNILIPDMFSALNAHDAFHDWNSSLYYDVACGNGHAKASECIKCGKCEKVCPQHLPIRKLLEDVKKAFGK